MFVNSTDDRKLSITKKSHIGILDAKEFNKQTHFGRSINKYIFN